MQLDDFYFDLPDHQIAQFPLEDRSGGKLMLLAGGVLQAEHRMIVDLPGLLTEHDLLVLNDTRVYPARLYGRKKTGGKVELLVERITGETNALCLCRSSKSPKAGTEIIFDDGKTAMVTGRQGDLFSVEFSLAGPLIDYLEVQGELPLPPYITRAPGREDQHRYQTVFARETGAVAAPTAGLHFDDELLSQCRSRCAGTAFITLHVGAGTFQPVRSDDLASHKMHAERLQVGADLCERVVKTKSNGGRVIAVGTTVVRALESAANSGALLPFEGETRLFLKPGDPFHVVDAMITNFHLPRSTLLMLVCAFAGTERVLDAYRQAVSADYRFFSYGDAMMLFPESVNP